MVGAVFRTFPRNYPKRLPLPVGNSNQQLLPWKPDVPNRNVLAQVVPEYRIMYAHPLDALLAGALPQVLVLPRFFRVHRRDDFLVPRRVVQ